jgi:inner membrane protein
MASAGSLVVDMDVKSSKASKMSHSIHKFIIPTIILVSLADLIFKTSFMVSAVSSLTRFGTAVVAVIIWTLMKNQSSHRGFTHSIIGMALMCFAVGIIFDTKYFFAFSIGYICHIVADLFNKKGCQLFYPDKKRFCLRICKSDGIVNDALFFVFGALSVIEIIIYFVRLVL